MGGVPQPVGAMGGTTASAMRIALLGSAETGMVLVPGGTACASYLCCFHRFVTHPAPRLPRKTGPRQPMQHGGSGLVGESVDFVAHGGSFASRLLSRSQHCDVAPDQSPTPSSPGEHSTCCSSRDCRGHSPCRRHGGLAAPFPYMPYGVPPPPPGRPPAPPAPGSMVAAPVPRAAYPSMDPAFHGTRPDRLPPPPPGRPPMKK